MVAESQARLWLAVGELDELWANVLLGAAGQALDGFTEKAIVDLHGKLARFACVRDTGIEVPVYPGERRLMVRLAAAGREADPTASPAALMALLLERPALLALDPGVEALVAARGRKQAGRSDKEGL